MNKMEKGQEIIVAIDKLNNIGKRLDFNIRIQSLLIVLGLYTVLAPEKLEDFKLVFEFDIYLASILIPILLMYFFIQFGYMLSNYHSLRKFIDNDANITYKNEPAKIQNLYDIYRENRMAELIYMRLKHDDMIVKDNINDEGIPKFKFSIYPLLTYTIMTLLSLNHTIIFVFILTNWSLLGVAVSLGLSLLSIIILVGLYRDYILSAKNKIFKRMTVFNGVLTIILTMAYVIANYFEKI